MELQFYDFCCNNGSPGWRDVQAGVTDQMIYQRNVVKFLIFPVGGVQFNLQDLGKKPRAQNQELICWRGPAAICWIIGLESGLWLVVSHVHRNLRAGRPNYRAIT
jgi:hypothetical protein